MKIIITGGSGMVGTILTAQLTQNGHQVIILSRTPEKHQERMPAGAQVVAWDGKTANGWGQHAEGVDAIVNLAGVNIGARRWTKERKRAILESRLNAGRAVVQAIQQAKEKPKTVIQAGAVGYYGTSDDRLLSESAPAGKDYLAGVCAQWEASTAAVEEMGVRRVVFRSAVSLTVKENPLSAMLLQMRLFAGGPLGSGKQWFPWIHLEDMVSAMHYCIVNQDTSGTYNLVAPDLMTNATFEKTLARVMKRPAFMWAPGFALRLVLGEKAIVVLEGQRVDPSRLVQAGFKFAFPQAEAAIRDLLARGI